MNEPTDEQLIAVDTLDGYLQMSEACARLVEASENQPLAAAAMLNATLIIALRVLGRERLESELLGVLANLPAAEAKARGRLT